MSKTEPFGIIDEFQPDIQVEESCFDLLKPGVTIRTTDERGQEVQIQFEASDHQEVEQYEVLDNEETVSEEIGSKNVTQLQESQSDENLVMVNGESVNLVYLCAEDNCGVRLGSKWELLEHTNSFHAADNKFEFVDEENSLVIEEDKRQEDSDLTESLECMNCDYRSLSMEGMKHHIETKHIQHPLEARSHQGFVTKKRVFRCPKCDLVVEKKFHLVRHIKLCHEFTVHKCRNCNYTTNFLLNYKKHLNKCCREDNEKDIYSESSVEKGITYKCVCTWCEYKSNKYSYVKKHIELYHENKRHFPCKECVFIGKTMDDYAMHFNSFHKMDHYRHACTDCSFKCTNRLDLRNHYIEVHKKQRLYACRLCQYKAQDVMTIKKHISKTHSTFLFHCKDCNFSSNKKNEFSRHCAEVHGDSCFKLNSDVFGQQIGQEVQEIVQNVDSCGEPVPETEILEEQIFDEQIVEDGSLEGGEVILEEQIEEEVVSDFFEGSVMLLSS